MKTEEYVRLAEKEDSYWWHLGRLEILRTYLKQASNNQKGLKILNIGAGAGGTINLLEKFGRVENVDTSQQAIKFMKLRGHRNVRKVDGTKLPFKKKSYDLIVAFDVLEHIKQQGKALKEWRRVLKDSGEIVITVPAYSWLWSRHDIALAHYRRYNLKKLNKAVIASGLKVKRQSYAITFTLPIVVGYRLVIKFFGNNKLPKATYVSIPNVLNWLFIKLLHLEARLHNFTTLPCGTSIIARLEK